MRDCRLVMTARNDRIGFEAEDISMEELAAMAGALQVLVGMEAVKKGADMDYVKDRMYDIYLESMWAVEKQLGEGRDYSDDSL